jgi:RNA polymerase sigma-70 factor (ECF subfamily)
MTDHQLMLAVRDGDLDKLGHLFEKYHKQLYNFFRRQTEDSQLCEDFVQEVFFRMLKYRHTYRGEAKFTTWMFSIAHNARIEHFRRAKHRKNFTDEIDRLVSSQPNPAELTERSGLHEILYKALDRLSDEKREVLVLSRFHNLKYEEISQIMGHPVGTIKARVFHAIKDLRMFFNEQTDEAKS